MLYIIYHRSTYVELESVIDNAFIDGWKCCGGIACSPNGFYQAMIRESDPPPAEPEPDEHELRRKAKGYQDEIERQQKLIAELEAKKEEVQTNSEPKKQYCQTCQKYPECQMARSIFNYCSVYKKKEN